jgi:hypothetical protein
VLLAAHIVIPPNIWYLEVQVEGQDVDGDVQSLVASEIYSVQDCEGSADVQIGVIGALNLQSPTPDPFVTVTNLDFTYNIFSAVSVLLSLRDEGGRSSDTRCLNILF